MSNYCHGFDKRDYACFLVNMVEDCVWKIGPPLAIFQATRGFRKRFTTFVFAGTVATRYIKPSVGIFDGPHTASGLCDVDCMGLLTNSPEATFVEQPIEIATSGETA